MAVLIKDRFKITLSAVSVGRLLAQLGITRQKPLHRAAERAAVFIEFLKRPIAGADRPIFLIVDRGSAHRAKKTQAFVETLGGKLRLFFLPPPAFAGLNGGRTVSRWTILGNSEQ